MKHTISQLKELQRRMRQRLLDNQQKEKELEQKTSKLKNMPFKEFKKTLKELKPIKEELFDLYAEDEIVKTKINALHENVLAVCFIEYMPKIMEILQKYQTKRLGAVTLENIRKEFYSIDENIRFWRRPYAEEFELLYKIGNKENILLDVKLQDNKIVFESVRTYQQHYNYIDDIDKKIEELNNLKSKLQEEFIQLDKMIKEYNAIAFYGVKHVESVYLREY